jgi:hypothetical protein
MGGLIALCRVFERSFPIVMAGLVPAIHVLNKQKDVDARV